MKFTKIRFSDGIVHLEWTTPAAEDSAGEIHHSLRHDQAPEPEFGRAFDALAPHVVRLLGVPRKWEEELEVYSVTLSQDKNGRMGAVFSCTIPLESFRAPFQFNTPYLPEPDVDDAGPQMSSELLEAVRELEYRALRYIQGARDQGELFAAGNGVAQKPVVLVGQKVRAGDRSYKVRAIAGHTVQLEPVRRKQGEAEGSVATIRTAELTWDQEAEVWMTDPALLEPVAAEAQAGAAVGFPARAVARSAELIHEAARALEEEASR